MPNSRPYIKPIFSLPNSLPHAELSQNHPLQFSVANVKLREEVQSLECDSIVHLDRCMLFQSSPVIQQRLEFPKKDSCPLQVWQSYSLWEHNIARLMRRRIIHSTYIYQSFELWNIRVINLHSDTLLVFLFFFHKGVQSLSLHIPDNGQNPYSACCNAPNNGLFIHASRWLLSNWGTIWSWECRESKFLIHLPFCTSPHLNLKKKNERLETGSYIFAYSKSGQTVFSGSTGVFFWLFQKFCSFRGHKVRDREYI